VVESTWTRAGADHRPDLEQLAADAAAAAPRQLAVGEIRYATQRTNEQRGLAFSSAASRVRRRSWMRANASSCSSGARAAKAPVTKSGPEGGSEPKNYHRAARPWRRGHRVTVAVAGQKRSTTWRARRRLDR